VIVILISGGLAMFTYQSTSFSLIGFMMVLIASFFSGIRWTLSQLIMQKSKLGLQNPVDFIYHIQPLMVLSLLPIAIGAEGIFV
jgi:solute carrier family 35 protein C2